MVVVGFNLRRWVGGKGVGFVDWIGKIGLFGKREPSMAEDNTRSGTRLSIRHF